MKLYEIQAGFRAWAAKVAEQDGELTEEDMQEINALEAAADDKIEAYAVIIKESLADAETYEKEIERLTEIKKRKKALADRLATRLDEFMHEQGRNKFESVKARVTYRKSVMLEVADDALLPEKFMRVKREPDKAQIKEYLKSGGELDGCRLIEHENINIK